MAGLNDCLRIKHSGITKATTTKTTNKIEQQEHQADGKQQVEEFEQGVNYFMQAFEKNYESDEDEYGIVCCTQSSVTVDYKRIGDRTVHLFKQEHQMVQDSWLLFDNYSTFNIIGNPNFVTNIHEVDQRCIITTNTGTGTTNLKATLN